MNTSATTSNNTALVVGATSSLAQALCRTLGSRGYALVLIARDEEELEMLAHDIHTRSGVPVRTIVADLTSADFSAPGMLEQAGAFTHVIIAVGDMGGADVGDLANLAYTIHVNYTLPAEIATVAANKMSGAGDGTVVIISSVAGDRGRQSNYPYGAAKSALTTFASGLRNYYHKRGVHVLTVKPGFVDTPMTWGMTSLLIASREYVAEKIVAAMEKKTNVLYVPSFWRVIMLIITHIPEAIFKRLRL